MKNIFVGNLDFSTRQEELRSLFESYGAVDRVTVVTDRDTGRSRGFAFVEMSADADAEKAIAALHGSEVNGRAINVNEAMPRPERGPRPGGGGGGFGGKKRSGGGGFGGGSGGGGGSRRREPRW